MVQRQTYTNNIRHSRLRMEDNEVPAHLTLQVRAINESAIDLFKGLGFKTNEDMVRLRIIRILE